MLSRVLLIVNPTAGRGLAVSYSQDLKQVLEDNHQSKIQVRITQAEGDATEWAKNAFGDGFDTVICLGGDGTVRETVQGLIQNPDRPYFAFIPMGTVNDLARALGYSLNPATAIKEMAKVKTGNLDIGLVNNSLAFINVVALGVIPESVMSTSSDDKNRLGPLAYFLDGFNAFFSEKGYELKITDDQDQVHSLMSNLVLIGLTNSIGGFEAALPEASYDDGLFHLIAVKGKTPLDTIRAAIQKNQNLFKLPKENLLQLNSKFFLIESKASSELAANIDGDAGPGLPLKLELLASALTVLIPDQSKSKPFFLP